MPARAERIYLYPSDVNQPGQVMEFPVWWDRRGFFAKYGERQIDTGHPLFVDYAILLTSVEALAWDKRCREKFYPNPDYIKPIILSKINQFRSALEKVKWLIVESYEWESGYG